MTAAFKSNQEIFVEEIKVWIGWMYVNKSKALSEFMQLFIGTADKYASIRK